MKCKRFYGKDERAINEFNEWAKGKKLTQDVLIHSDIHAFGEHMEGNWIEIIVFYPELSEWDT